MKAFSYLLRGLLVIVLLLAIAMPAVAQDPVVVAPALHKVKLDNKKVRVYEVMAKAGDKMAMHWHPDHIVCPLKDGKVKFTMPDGKTREVDMKAGEALWVDSQSHSVEFLTDASAMVIELKKKEKKEMKEPKQGK
ncbi:MAG: hypothetical protein HW412_2499 [Bacteroidetes bacterium]|nr:hypothetical protein [Bacteroidota bacterium]